MGDGSVDRNQQIELRENRGGVGKILEILAERDDAMPAQNLRLRRTNLFLHADEIEIGQRKDLGETLGRNRTIMIVQMRVAAGPAQADAQPPGLRQPLTPFGEALLIGRI